LITQMLVDLAHAETLSINRFCKNLVTA
jgi:hypothetical protein